MNEIRINTRDENGIVQPVDPAVARAFAELGTKITRLLQRSSAQMHGPELKLAREIRGLTVEDAATAVGLKSWQLELIEQPGGWVNGNWQHPLVRAFDALYKLAAGVQRCRQCGCSSVDGSGCHARIGKPCVFVDKDLCSACASQGRF